MKRRLLKKKRRVCWLSLSRSIFPHWTYWILRLPSAHQFAVNGAVTGAGVYATVGNSDSDGEDLGNVVGSNVALSGNIGDPAPYPIGNADSSIPKMARSV